MSFAGVAGRGARRCSSLGAWSNEPRLALRSGDEVPLRQRSTADPANPGGYVLMLDELPHSYVDLARSNQPRIRLRRAGSPKRSTPSSPPKAPIDVVFVGGGGFTLPRWLEATRPGSHGLGARGRPANSSNSTKSTSACSVPPACEIIDTGDARVNMRNVPDASADVVVGDAFGTLAIPWHLATTEWTDEVKRVLKPGGLYALNVIDTGPENLLKAETATVLGTFRHVRIVTNGELEHPAGGNAVLLASDRPIPAAADTENPKTFETTLSEPEVKSFAADAEKLSDDYAPADQLLTKP